MKVVINACYGGFGLSPEALLWMYQRGATYLATPVSEYYGPHEYGGKTNVERAAEALATWRKFQSTGEGSIFLTVFTPDEQSILCSAREIERNDPLLIQCVEELGERVNGACAALTIVEIPDGVEWCIEEYDGSEHVAEKHRTWS